MRLLKPAWVSHGFLSKDKAVGRPIYSLDIHPDGSRLATGGVIDTCGVVVLWNMAPIRDPTLESNENFCPKLFQMDSHQACVNCVRWSPSGRWLASAGMDKVIMLWSKTAVTSRPIQVFGSKEPTKFTEHWRCVSTLRGHSGDIIDLSWSHDGSRLASTSVDNSVIVWCRQKFPSGSGYTSNSFCLQATLRGHTGFVKGVTWDPVGRYLASQGDDLTVKIWRTADWQEEASISKPFTKASGQSQVMRLSWSLDGSTLASPHAVNNGFPTAKLIDRTNWSPSLDLVGHRKHVICARYNPNVLRKQDGSGNPGAVCLALGSKDRSVSVWSTAGRRARIVVHDLFTNSVCDLSWSSDGRELMACSLDGSVCYMGFTHKELGTPWSLKEVIQLHHKIYGQSLLDKIPPISSSNGLSTDIDHSDENKDHSSLLNQSDILLETPEALALQKTQAELRTKLKHSLTQEKQMKCLPKGPSKQIETVNKDGRRRITPKFLGYLDSPDEDVNSNPQFSSAQSNKCENKPGSEASSDLTSDSNKSNHAVIITVATTTSTISTSAVNPMMSKTVVSDTIPTVSLVQVNNGVSPCVKKTCFSEVVDSVPVSTITTTQTNGTETTPLSTTLCFDHAPLTAKASSELQPLATFVQTPSKKLTLEPATTPVTTTTSAIDQEMSTELKRPRLDSNNNDTDHVKLTSDEATKHQVTTTGNKQRKRRIRLFAEEEKSPKSWSDASKSVVPNKKPCFTPESSPPKLKLTTGSVVESSDYLSSSVQNQSMRSASFPPFLITTSDQLGNTPKVQFVCSNLVDGPIIVQLINSSNSSTRGDEVPRLSNSVSRIVANRSDRRLWELVCTDRITSYAYSDEIVAVGDNKGRIQLIYSSGGHVCPNLLLDCVHTLALTPETTESFQTSSTCRSFTTSTESTMSNNNSNNLSRLHAVVSGNEQRTTLMNNNNNNSFTFQSNINNNTINRYNVNRKYRLAALCRSGRLILWNFCLTKSGFGSISPVFNACAFPQVLVETNIKDVLNGGNNSQFSSLTFGPNGYPIVYLQDNSSYLFHIESRIWIELFDASDTVRCQFAVNSARGCPPGPLSACQQFNKITMNTHKSNPSNSSNANILSASCRKVSNRNFLEVQTQLALSFGSPNEYRYWLTRWFRQLIEDNEEERVRQIIQDLIGPVPVTSKLHSTWESEVKGISKHVLAKELLSLFALNLHLQRLYVELKEMMNE
ncbi:Protein HIRA [Schistosoma japonicum]|nr:Protein HIRA [Schistosoma japonicum]